MEQTGVSFDEQAAEALSLLLEQFWVIREQEPDKYQLIREREKVLRSYCLEWLGLRLIIHRHFAKLEKVPVEPQRWMGLQEFLHPRDYALFCLLLAYLENRAVDEQFLLSSLCEELASLYPGEEGLDWTHYEHRKSLVRVLLKAVDTGLLKVVDGNTVGFNDSEEQEVLYEVTVMSRYFMRSFPKDLSLFTSTDELLAAEHLSRGGDDSRGRRHSIFQRLLLEPAIYSRGTEDPDFRYLRNQRNSIRENIEKHSFFQFELYRNAAFLTIPERKQMYTLFPDNRAITDLILQLAELVREKRTEEDIPLQYNGSVQLTAIKFEGWLMELKEKWGSGWSKEFREMSLPQLTTQLLQELEDWQMACRDAETGVISLMPLLVRLTGRYPADFNPDQALESKMANFKGEDS